MLKGLNLFVFRIAFIFCCSPLLADAVKNEYLIKFKPQISTANFYQLGQALRSFDNFPLLHHRKLSDLEVRNFVSLASDQIEYIEPVYKVSYIKFQAEKKFSYSGKSDFKNQWALENSKDTDVNILEAWKHTKGHPNIVVAVIDTGVDYRHKDLKNQIWKNPGEIPNNGIDDDGNGYIDDVHGWNFHGDTLDPLDDNGHGTHCSGIIAAQGLKAWGAAPRVKIMSLKFLSARGSGSTADAISAIDYAITMKANVLSNSWGGGDYSKALEDTFLLAKDKNIIVVTAAGNSGQDISERPMYPAALNLDNMLTVANINESGKLHLSSNYSKDLVHLAAPGTRIFSTYLDNNYASLTGTSMAAPYVSAAAAMLYSRHENISYQAVKQILMNNVKRLASLVKTNKSNGSLDIGAALKSSLGEPPSPPSPPAPPPREGVSFKPELVKIEKNVSKKWYRVHYRVKLALTSAQENLDMIKKVSYYYRRGLTSSRVVTSTSHGNSFSVGLKTKYPKQIFKIEITDSQGKVHLIYR